LTAKEIALKRNDVKILSLFDSLEEIKKKQAKLAPLKQWFEQLGLQEYFDNIVEQGFQTVEEIKELTDTDLKEIGINKLGHRRRILQTLKNDAYLANVTSSVVRICDIGCESLKTISPIYGLFNQPEYSLNNAIDPLKPIIKDIEIHTRYSLDFAKEIATSTSNLEGIAAINLYTREWSTSLYKILNEHLRMENREKLKPFYPYLHLLLKTLNILPNFQGTVWRGVKKDLSSLYTQGQKLFWWAFSSTTVDKETLTNEMFLGKSGERTLFQIHCKRGVIIQKYSLIPSECEILLFPAFYFEVIHSLDLGNNLHLIELREMDPPFPVMIV